MRYIHHTVHTIEVRLQNIALLKCVFLSPHLSFSSRALPRQNGKISLLKDTHWLNEASSSNAPVSVAWPAPSAGGREMSFVPRSPASIPWSASNAARTAVCLPRPKQYIRLKLTVYWAFCVAKNNSCCSPLVRWSLPAPVAGHKIISPQGPGKTGTDGVPLPTDSVTATATGSLSAPSPSASGWTCTRADSGEQCCQRGGSFLHWCSGSFPNNRCYNPSSQTCCSEGTVCEGENCCDIVVCLHATLILPCLADFWRYI